MELGTYIVKWKHEKKDTTYLLYDHLTRCIVKTKDLHLPIVETTALCSKKDVFSKEKGRKISLKRALEKLHLTKQERIKIWKDYFNRKANLKI